MTTIFRLESVWVYEQEDTLYRDTSFHVLGYYSSLDKAIAAIGPGGNDYFKDEYTYAYIVKEFAVDSNQGDYSAPLSIRSFDRHGAPVDECPQDYNLVNQFKGRHADTIRFRIGDIVEVLEGDRLYTAIVAALPPTPEDKFKRLDALDDAYMVLPLKNGANDHLHIPPTHSFPLSHPLEEECISYLRTRLRIFQGRQDETDMRSICKIEGHEYLYDFATLPGKSICRRCHQKWRADYSGDLTNGYIWKEVDHFANDPRTDEELIKAWGRK